MFLSAVLRAATFAALLSFPAAAVPMQWSGNGHYYEVRPAISSWDLANTDANSSLFLGAQGHLVTFSSKAEEDFVMSLAGISAASRMYIGLRLRSGGSLTVSSDYLWVTGEGMSYSNWGPGQPDAVFGDAFYVTMYFSSNLEWQWDNAGIGAGPYAYVVEYAPAPVPEPDAGWLAGAGLLAVCLWRCRT